MIDRYIPSMMASKGSVAEAIVYSAMALRGETSPSAELLDKLAAKLGDDASGARNKQDDGSAWTPATWRAYVESLIA